MSKSILTFNFIVSGNVLAQAKRNGLDGYYNKGENITVVSVDVKSMREAKARMKKAGLTIQYIQPRLKEEEDAEY